MEEDILNYLYQLSCFVGHPVLSHRIFPKWQRLKGIFLSENFPNVEFPKRQLSKSFLAAALRP